MIPRYFMNVRYRGRLILDHEGDELANEGAMQLVRVHSVLREALTFDDISVHRSDRMDNLLKDHS